MRCLSSAALLERFDVSTTHRPCPVWPGIPVPKPREAPLRSPTNNQDNSNIAFAIFTPRNAFFAC